MSTFFDTSSFTSFSKSTPTSSSTRVIPAQVNFLTIFNPSLGDTEETESDQIVFWATKADLLAAHERLSGRKGEQHEDNSRLRSGLDASQAEQEQAHTDRQSEEMNYQLRQIGLARGMVDFVKNFSNDKPVSSIETQKARIILHELEQGWWVLAKVDLTRLPVSVAAQGSTPKGRKEGTTKDKNSVKKDSAGEQQYEYSAREVAPPQLLLAQILKAHQLFLLHHAATLWDLYNRVGKARFNSHLQKFWEKFLWDWDVLLHGSPAVEIYGACTKLAGAGELGIGVGEEEWGSGEREVLEGFVSRTEGCLDLIVGRYGEGPPRKKRRKDISRSSSDVETEEADVDQSAWIGNGVDPGPADGIIFSGIGMLSRRSLSSLSHWIETIFKYGEDSYGVGENPSARQRQKRRPQRSGPTRKSSDTARLALRQAQDAIEQSEQNQEEQEMLPKYHSPKHKAPDLRRQALENSALPPGIPAPLVASVERSLDEAIAKAESRASSKSPTTSPSREKTQDEAIRGEHGQGKPDGTSSWFDTDKMTKVFKLGYGTSWTLSPKGFSDQGAEESPKGKKVEEEDLLLPEELPSNSTAVVPPRPSLQRKTSKPAEERLQEIDPTPEVSDEENKSSKPFFQHVEKSMGRFIIGLSGDLENTEFDADEDNEREADMTPTRKAQRLFLRTLTVEMASQRHRPSVVSTESTTSQRSHMSVKNQASNKGGVEPKTSAAASVDGPMHHMTRHEKVQVAVYVHQPFIFVFLFSLHTPNLTMPSFYRGIHHQLGPLQAPLLKRTDPTHVTARMREAILSQNDDDIHTSTRASSQLELAASGVGNTIYDLVYDPSKLTIRTSIPNIPVPASLADQSSAIKNNTISGSWYTLGIPIGSMSSQTSPSCSISPQQDPDYESTSKSRIEPWSRLDALNVHQQILNTYTATHSDIVSNAPTTMATTSKSAYSIASAAPYFALLNESEVEQTVKTNRGWWVLWMRVSSPSVTGRTSTRSHTITSKSPSRASSFSDHQAGATSKHALPIILAQHSDKEAFLIRKSTDSLTNKASVKPGNSSPMSGSRWLLREQPRELRQTSTGGTTGSSGIITARSVGDGVGIDARRWIDGLLSLTS